MRDAEEVENFLKQEGINLIPHPPYSPDLFPCDYWLNDYIISKIVFIIPEKEYKKTFEKLIERMKLCIKNGGNYFEHLIE